MKATGFLPSLHPTWLEHRDRSRNYSAENKAEVIKMLGCENKEVKRRIYKVYGG